MKTFTIHDEDGNSLGIIQTTADEELIQSLYEEFLEADDEVQGDIEEFIIFCQDKEPDEYFERYFIDGGIYPSMKGYENYLKTLKDE